MKRHIECPKCGVAWCHQAYPPGSWTEFSEPGKWCSSCKNLRNMVNVIHAKAMDGLMVQAEDTAGWVREIWPDGYRRKTSA